MSLWKGDGEPSPSLLQVEIFFRRLAQHPAAENNKAVDQNEHESYADDRRRDYGIGTERDRNDLQQAHKHIKSRIKNIFVQFHSLRLGGCECDDNQKEKHERDHPGDRPASCFAYAGDDQAGSHYDIALNRQHADHVAAVIDGDPEIHPGQKDKEHGS